MFANTYRGLAANLSRLSIGFGRGEPVAREIDATGHEHIIAVLVQSLQDTQYGREAAGAPANAQMEPDIQEACLTSSALLNQNIQRRSDIAHEGGGFNEAVRVEELHVVAIEGVRQDKEAARRRLIDIRDIVVECVGVVEKAQFCQQSARYRALAAAAEKAEGAFAGDGLHRRDTAFEVRSFRHNIRVVSVRTPQPAVTGRFMPVTDHRFG